MLLFCIQIKCRFRVIKACQGLMDHLFRTLSLNDLSEVHLIVYLFDLLLFLELFVYLSCVQNGID